MSTILKALKKLEQEKESSRPSGPIPVYSGSHATTGGTVEWFQSPWFKRGLGGLAFLVVCLTAVYFYVQSRDTGVPSMRSDPADTAREKAPSSTLAGRDQGIGSKTSPVKKEIPNAAVGENPDQSGQSAVVRPPASLLPASNAPEIMPKIQSPAVPPASNAPTPVAKPAPLPPTQNTPPAGPDKSSAPIQTAQGTRSPNGLPGRQQGNQGPDQDATPPEPLPVKSASPDTYKNTPPLTDGRLKVHAIAWSPTPAERMAVVNSRVAYEGDIVDGFVVVAIRQEDVVVREKDKGMWRVLFGRP